MITAYLNRFEKSDQGSVGVFSLPAFGFSCFSIELPWRDNKGGLSCISVGEYLVKMRWSKKYRWHYHITDVAGRSWILFHSGNWAGDVKKEYRTHSMGCILLGQKLGYLGG